MFDRVLDTPLPNNLLYLTEGLKRSFPLQWGKGILDLLYQLIPLNNTKNKMTKPWTHTASSFPWVTPRTKRKKIWSSFTYSFLCAWPSFDQQLWSLLNYFFCMHAIIRPIYIVLLHLFFLLHTTIWPKYMVFFHLFFLLCTTIRPTIMILIDFFFPPDYSTNMSGPLSLILSFANGHSNKNLGPHWFISFIYARPFDQNKCSSFIYSFSSGRPVDQKLGSSLTFFLFVHDHSIKIRAHSYSLIYSFLNCANISYTLFIAIWCLSPCYHASHPNLILRGGHTNRSPYLLVLLGQPSLPSIRGQ